MRNDDTLGRASRATSVHDAGNNVGRWASFVRDGLPLAKTTELANSHDTYVVTDALEFVFATSDLIDAGWDISEWLGRTSSSHPFGAFMKRYSHYLKKLEDVLSEGLPKL